MADLPINYDTNSECRVALNDVVMQKIYRVESGGNPYAIGVVGGHLERQPKNLSEGVATAKWLLEQGFNFSIGKGQVNKVHFDRLGWQDLSKGFDECSNIVAAYKIYQQCYSNALKLANTDYTAIDGALSCYYSGGTQNGKTNPDVARYINAVKSVFIPDSNTKIDDSSNIIRVVVNSSSKINKNATISPEKKGLLSSNGKISKGKGGMMLSD